MNDREKLIDILVKLDTYGCEECQKCASFKYDLPCNDKCFCEKTADHLIANGVVVREKGEWDDSYDGITPYCTVCGRSHRGMNRTPDFCPNCGADMRIEEQNRAREENDG